jgi:hypothetical protein
MGPWLIDFSERGDLEKWLADAHSRPSAMLIRGDSSRVREMLPNALDAAKRDPGRVVLWVKEEELLAELPCGEPFRRDADVNAVVLDRERRPRAWVYYDQIAVSDFAFAYDQAEGA